MINYLATGTFGILLIHDHNFFRYVLWKNLLQTDRWYGSGIFVLFVIAVVIWIYVVGFVIDRIRVILLEQKIFQSMRIKKLCKKCDGVFEKTDENER